MSEFFLDTQLSADDRARIAGTLNASGYAVRELDRILWEELCPVLWGNLILVAGEWVAFDMDDVERRILSRPAGVFRRWRAYLGGGRIARHEWARVRALLSADNGSTG